MAGKGSEKGEPTAVCAHLKTESGRFRVYVPKLTFSRISELAETQTVLEAQKVGSFGGLSRG